MYFDLGEEGFISVKERHYIVSVIIDDLILLVNFLEKEIIEIEEDLLKELVKFDLTPEECNPSFLNIRKIEIN
jgi:hypothetical protein